jgi:predicted O-methyltransferase YrrM
MTTFTTELLQFKNDIFIETGTYQGATIEIIKNNNYYKPLHIYSIELSDVFYENCKEKFKDDPNITIIKGNSKYDLYDLIKNIYKPITFWLDSHWSGVKDVGFDSETICPILYELEQIKNHSIKTHTIMIDDMRLMDNLHFPVTKDEIIKKIFEINPNYKIKYFDTLYGKQDVLVAYFDKETISNYITIPINNIILDNFKLKNHEYLKHTDYYDLESGNQEYRLYSYLTEYFNNITILDIGTLDGRSAIALSHNETNKVISYDIVNNINNDNHIIYTKKNVEFRIKNVLDDLTEDFIKNVKIVMIDIDHYENIETKIINKLKELNYSGIIILDDTTHHPDPLMNECMNRLWNNIQYTKYDFKKYGHWSGTGIFLMNYEIQFLFIDNN